MTSAASPAQPPTAHEHAWPLTADGWNELVGCRTCGLLLLRGFVGSAQWVVRRVESIDFVDDRTVRRRVSVDYTVPRDAVTLRVGDKQAVRILPLALMRRKNMINFDFRDHDGRPMPLLGLRENQALTLAVVHAWAATTIGRVPPQEITALLDDIVAGDQSELTEAYRKLKLHSDQEPDLVPAELSAVLERLAGNFVLFASETATPGTRRIVKWSYDEPLTLLHSTTGYHGHPDGPCPGRTEHGDPQPVTYGRTGRRLEWWRSDPLCAGLGLRPTLIRFPTPGAELAASFHVEITAPPEVSIVEASLLAGTPNLRFVGEDAEAGPDADREGWSNEQGVRTGNEVRRHRLRRRPSFDSIGGGYPTVDLHVADVPYGSLSLAQVQLQASPTGWLASAWLATLLATALLLAAGLAPESEDSAELIIAVLVGFAAAMVAIVVRPDPHLMVTRLLTRLRMLAAASAVLVLAGGCAFAFAGSDDAQLPLLLLAGASAIPTITITEVWRRARRRLVRDSPPRKKAAQRRRQAREEPPAVGEDMKSWERRLHEARRTAPMIRLSPWEQHLPDQSLGDHVDTAFHVALSQTLEDANYPYDRAVVELGFDKPAIKVASLEGDRSAFRWTRDFEKQFWKLLDAQLQDAPRSGRFSKTGPSAGARAVSARRRGS